MDTLIDPAGPAPPDGEAPGDTPTASATAFIDSRPGGEPARRDLEPASAEETASQRVRRARAAASGREHPTLVGSGLRLSLGSGKIPPVAKALDDFASEIRSELQALGALMNDALGRKLRIGELLAGARARCKAEHASWGDFLESCEMSDRTAREAIQFHKNREALREDIRNGGAALTVTAARKKLSAAGGRGGPPDEADQDPAPGSSVGVPGPRRGVRAAGPDAGLPATAMPRLAPVDAAEVEGDPAEILGTGRDGPAPSDAEAVPTDLTTHVHYLNGLCEEFLGSLDEAIGDLASTPGDATAALAALIPGMHHGLDRLEASLRASGPGAQPAG